MKVVTSGAPYIDIDAYAGCIAYAELLNLLGEEACAVSTAPLNESITATVRSWPTMLARQYKPNESDYFVMIDLSDPGVFDSIVDQTKIVEIIDHHMEFVNYWQKHPGVKTDIEFIGAACTLVFEHWQKANKLNEISETSARLLMTGILDNTLNFKAGVTTERDHKAYAELARRANLSEDWPAQYFAECQQETIADIKSAVQHDIKIVEFPSLQGKIGTGQLVVWNAEDVVNSELVAIREVMIQTGDNWLMNIVSIAEGRNYVLVSGDMMQDFIAGLIGAKFEDGVGITDRLWLRKEIMKADLDANK